MWHWMLPENPERLQNMNDSDNNPEKLQEWIQTIANNLANDETPDPEAYTNFLDTPILVHHLVTYMDILPDEYASTSHPLYSACLFLLDISVTQLNTMTENGNKSARKLLKALMNYLAEIINQSQHGAAFWLPALNAFYDTHTELTPDLKEAYFNLSCAEEIMTDEEEQQHMESMHNLLMEMADLSPIDIANNFFAQSYAMPPEFFPDLIIDLFSVQPSGPNIGILFLLHPDPVIREEVVGIMHEMLQENTISSASLSRLKSIKTWYPEPQQRLFETWIRDQRKKGVVFLPELSSKPVVTFKATEVDGSGSQGVFVHIHQGRTHRMGGVLLKYSVGLKDIWTTERIPVKEVRNCYETTLDENVTLRSVTEDYFVMMVQHFLAETLEKGQMPDLHLLELQELLGLQLKPEKIDVDFLINTIAVQITPFTEAALQESLKRSASWAKKRRFAESWFMENSTIDKLVNGCCTFVNGVKICKMDDAMDAIYAFMENHREYWLFHFLWTALWAKSDVKKREKTWEDSFFIAYAIKSGQAIKNIPLMQAICHKTVTNSVETMVERGTYLN